MAFVQQITIIVQYILFIICTIQTDIQNNVTKPNKNLNLHRDNCVGLTIHNR